MEIYKQKDSRNFWCTFVVNGRRYRLSTNETSKTGAQTVAIELMKKVERGIGVKPGQIPTLEKYSTHFREYLEKHSKLEEKSRESYLYGWLLLSKQQIAQIPMDRITTQHVDMISIQGSPSTHNCALRTLRRMIHLAVEEGLIRRDRMPNEPKFPKIKLLKERRRKELIDYNDDEVISAVLASKRPGRPFGALKVAWTINMDTGLRPCEVVNLRVEDIDFQHMTITVGKSKSSSGEGRKLPISQRMRDILIKQVNGRFEGWLFPSPKHPGKPITRATLTKSFASVRRRANLPIAKKLYTARHTFGTELMNRTGDPYLVMEAMGHSDLAVGKYYQHKNVKQIADAISERNQERQQESHSFSHSGTLLQ